MKIGDRIYVRGYVDEIRKDTVIIRNEGGYFGTVKSEIVEAQKAEDIVSVIRCCDCVHFEYFEDQFVQMTHCDVHDKCPDYTDFCSWAERKDNG